MRRAWTPERRRFALAYAAAWTPFCLLYTLAIAQQSGGDVVGALFGGTVSTAIAAGLGLVVWRYAPQIMWREGRIRAVALHIIGCGAYVLLWTGSIYAQIAAFAPPAALERFMEMGLLFQAVNGFALYAMIAGLASWSSALRVAQSERDRAANAEVLRIDAELRALRAQLNPHFLFNTLHTITGLVGRDPQRAEVALRQLSDLLRTVLGANESRSEVILLDDELRFVRAYLDLESFRLGDRLHVEWNVTDDALDCDVLAFTVQTLVENAVRHGIAPRARGGTIRIEASIEDQRLVLVVSDDGNGSAETPAETGVGLRTIRRRMHLRYGDDASLRIRTAPGKGFEVRVTTPATVVRTPVAVGS